MECEKCNSDKISVIKEEKELKYDFCTKDYEEFSALYIKCEKCGYEFIECV